MSRKGPFGGGHGSRTFEKPQNIKLTIKQLLGYLDKSLIWLGVVVILIILSSGAMIAGTYLIKPIINDYILPSDFSGLARMLILLGIVYGAGGIMMYAYNKIMVKIAQEAVLNIRADLFHKMQKLPIKYFDTNVHGEIMSIYTNDVDNVMEMLANTFTSLISNALTFVGALVMIFILSIPLTLIKLASLLVMGYLIKVIGKRSQENYRLQQQNLGKVNGYIEEIIEGQKVVKVFNYEKRAMGKFDEINADLMASSTKAETYAGMIMPLMSNISNTVYAILATVGGLLSINGLFDIGGLIAYLQYNRMVSNPITQISQLVNVVLAGMAGAERIFALINQQPEIDEGTVTLTPVRVRDDQTLERTSEYTGKWAWCEIQSDKTVKLTELKGDVRFNDVVFSYDGKVDVLKKISLFAKPGQKIAFVGKTGAGKTTITNLINRFYDIQEGTITYDGIDIKKIRKDDLRRSLSMVLQDTHLFTGTIADNIRYGNLNATDDEIVAASKLANSYSFISRLPEGFDTVLTNDGENLSQGQRQLLSITRAAVANPPVLILDEATSSIDTRTEKLIEKGMDRLMENRTVFVIAHRLSTVKNAKAILVIEDGNIIERGSHEELLKDKGKYYQLYTGLFE